MFSNFGWMELIIILLVVALIFGTKKLRGLGGDLGSAVRGFRQAMSSSDSEEADKKDRKSDTKDDK